MTMLAAMFYASFDVRMEYQPVPQPGAGEVLLKVVAATTCGTDVKTYLRGHPLLMRKIPSRFGHEVAGFVAAIGPGVTQCTEGDAIVIANSAPCQQCFYCKRGNFSICEDLLLLNGAYAEYILVPERIVRMNLYHLVPGSSFIAAALTEPLACALHGVDACEIAKGDTVVILGSGPLGLLLTAIAKLKGAYTIITGRNSDRLALANRFGADVVIDIGQCTLGEQKEAIIDKTEARRGAHRRPLSGGQPWRLTPRPNSEPTSTASSPSPRRTRTPPARSRCGSGPGRTSRRSTGPSARWASSSSSASGRPSRSSCWATSWGARSSRPSP